jgi:tetratricopeptide (TPR) repeat protein
VILVGAFIFFVVIFSSSSTDPQIYLQAAKDFYDTDQYDSAYVNFRRVLAIDDENTDALFGYGNTLYTRGHPDSSIYYYDKVLSIDPEFNDAQYNKAWVFNQRKMYNESIEEAEILLEKEPSYYAAYQLLGDCYYAQTKYDDALMNYEQAYNNQWRNLWVCHVMAYLYETKGDVNRALSLYKEALQFDENNTEILKRLSELVPGEEGANYRNRLAELSR